MPSEAHFDEQLRSLPGLHDHVLGLVRAHAAAGGRVVDLGAWRGQLADGLAAAGFAATAADYDPKPYRGDAPFTAVDLDAPDFAARLDGDVDAITAVEVIEHLEAPLCFLRGCASLLKPGGVLVLTTPNMQAVPARLAFALRGRLRTMDAANPEHINPVFAATLVDDWFARVGFEAVDVHAYPARGWPLTRRRLWPLLRMLGWLLRGPFRHGDSLVVVARRAAPATTV